MTIEFYDTHAHDFFQRTKAVDMSRLYEPFLAMVPSGGHILDAGCGSGRDAKAFFELGYRVTAFDASQELVKLATVYTGLPILCMTFEKMDFEAAFDGIWACASLLHVTRAQMVPIFRRFIRALKVGGVWYVSYKWGQSEREKDGRKFTDFDEPGFMTFVRQFPCLAVERIWQTADLRPDRPGEKWLNVLLRRAC